MDHNHDNTDRKCPIKVLLDGKAVRLPREAMQSLASVRAHLELLALRQDRILAALSVDGRPINLWQAARLDNCFKRIQAHSIGFEELGMELAVKARKQLQVLLKRVETAVVWVLINPWNIAYRVTQQLQTETQGLLILFGFFQELCDLNTIDMKLGIQSFQKHLAGLDPIQRRLEALENRQDVLVLSDELEHYLLPWLRHMDAFVTKLCATK